MSNTTFRNASGWPDPEHRTSARDLAILADATIRNFPEMYRYYAEREFTYSRISQRNRNPLLSRFRGADGLKTGHTEAAGYGLTASATKKGRRLILVLNGLPSERARRVNPKGSWIGVFASLGITSCSRPTRRLRPQAYGWAKRRMCRYSPIRAF